MNGLVTINQQTKAKLNIQRLAGGKDPGSRQARLRFHKTLVNFLKHQQHPHIPADRDMPRRASVTLSNGKRHPPRGLPLAELLVSNSRPAAQDDYPEYLRLLHDVLCASLQVKDHEECYTANIGLTHVKQSGEANDEIPFDCFFLHRHLNSSEKTATWKQAQFRVFLQR